MVFIGFKSLLLFTFFSPGKKCDFFLPPYPKKKKSYTSLPFLVHLFNLQCLCSFISTLQASPVSVCPQTLTVFVVVFCLFFHLSQSPAHPSLLVTSFPYCFPSLCPEYLDPATSIFFSSSSLVTLYIFWLPVAPGMIWPRYFARVVLVSDHDSQAKFLVGKFLLSNSVMSILTQKLDVFCRHLFPCNCNII